MSDNLPTDIGILSVSFFASLMLTLWVRKFLVARALMDIPNERSSHTSPVPRGGGWALVAVLFSGLLLTTFIQKNLIDHLGVFLGLIILVLVSWQDDRKGVSAAKRLSLHILAACMGSIAFTNDQTLFSNYLPFWLDRTIMIIGWAWFMNLYNFMDGIDGITGSQTIAMATGICLVMSAIGMDDPFVTTLTLLLTGTCLGFLVLNWHPAKIFMGDVGSVPLGFLVGFGLLSMAVNGYLLPALILPLYYLADSGITLAKRALRGEKVWQAHRQHFYQQAARKWRRHDRVVYALIALNFLLILASIISVAKPWQALMAAIVIVALMLRKMHTIEP